MFQRRVETILLTSIVLPGIVGCGLSCPDATDSEVRSCIGQVTAPGTQIISDGDAYDGYVGVSTHSIVAVVRDGQAFLYHPDVGAADLSEETSRRAVGAFLLQAARDDDDGISKAINLRALDIGQSTRLSTGVTVRRVGNTTYEATNSKRRWVAIKRGEVDAPVFIPPRATYGTVSIYEWSQIVDADFHLETTAEFSVQAEAIETFGAVSRAMLQPAILPFVIASASVPLDKDPILFMRLNALDFEQVVVDGVFKIIGVVPGGDCANSVLRRPFVGIFETIGIEMLTGDEGLAEDFAQQLTADFIQDVAQCGCEASVYCLPLSKLLNILAAGSWIIDEGLLAQWDILHNDAYASLDVTDPPQDTDDDGIPDDRDDCRYAYNPSQNDRDRDDVGDACDDCPDDPNKTLPGDCGCGHPEILACGDEPDSDDDGIPDNEDGCPLDPNKSTPGDCNCGVAEGTCRADVSDLALAGLAVTWSSGSARTFLACSFNIINHGPTALSSEGIFVEYFLSDDTAFGDGDDRKIGDTGFTVSIPSGAIYTINLNSTGLSNMTRDWTPDRVPDASYYLFAEVQISDGSPFDPASTNDHGGIPGTINSSGSGDPSNSCQYAFDGECDDGRAGSVTSLCAVGTDSADCTEFGTGLSADFSEQTIAGTISISVGQTFRWNDFYQIWRIESSGGGFTGSFNSPSGGTYQLVVDHTSSAYDRCPGGGYSPVTIRVNGTTVAECWDPAANNGGTHGSAIDEWTIHLNPGANTMEWAACNLCTHYWIRAIEIR